MQHPIGFGPAGPARFRAAQARRRLMIWLPLVSAGAFLYWTLALGLGGLSMALIGPSVEDLELVPPPAPMTDGWISAGIAEADEPIVVQLQSAGEDVVVGALPDEATPAGEAGRGGTDENAVVSPTAPGRTAF